MSKIGKPKTSLLTEFFSYDSEILSSQIKLQKKIQIDLITNKNFYKNKLIKININIIKILKK